jgi:hypothetical protein
VRARPPLLRLARRVRHRRWPTPPTAPSGNLSRAAGRAARQGREGGRPAALTVPPGSSSSQASWSSVGLPRSDFNSRKFKSQGEAALSRAR